MQFGGNRLIELTDIFPVRTIYLGSGFAVLVWMLPYAFGLVFHYFKIRRWLKGTGWLFLILLIPSFMLARVFGFGLENDLYTPRTILMSATCVVTLGQAVFWGLLWTEHRRRGESAAWRMIANVAFISSLVLSFLSFGSFYVEKRYRYLEGVRLQQEAQSDQKHLRIAGYAPYPNATYRFGDPLIRAEFENEVLAGYPQDNPGGYNESLSINFRTSDDPLSVIRYFTEHALNAGMSVKRGVSRTTGELVMAGVEGNGYAIVVEKLTETSGSASFDWIVTIYWDIPKNFLESLDVGFELEGV